MIRDTPLLEVRGLTKRFGGTPAVDEVDFTLRRGEIHALLGENGAGKSTIIKILAGVHPPDAGEIRMGGERVDPSHAGLPIAFVHQDLGLVDTMTVSENIGLVIGFDRVGPAPVISWGGSNGRAREVLQLVASEVDPADLVSTLDRTDQSIVAIARALALVDREVLILDEPTASLPETEVERLFRTLDALRERGIGVLYVTHRLDEVFRIADTATVIRNGRRVATTGVADTTEGELVEQIVGRRADDVFVSVPLSSSVPVLRVRRLFTPAATDVSFDLAPGDLLGLVGLQGAGQHSVGRALFGDEQVLAGSISLDGAEFAPQSPREAIGRGIGLVPGKRAEEGLAESLSVLENLLLNPQLFDRKPWAALTRRGERGVASKLLHRYDVRPAGSSEWEIANLSGGNQQKVVLGRWLEAARRLLVLEDPTFGVDIGAKADIYRLIADILTRGAAALLVSSDFEEVANVCTGALVFRDGRIVEQVDRERLSVNALVHLAAGRAWSEKTHELPTVT